MQCLACAWMLVVSGFSHCVEAGARHLRVMLHVGPGLCATRKISAADSGMLCLALGACRLMLQCKGCVSSVAWAKTPYALWVCGLQVSVPCRLHHLCGTPFCVCGGGLALRSLLRARAP